MIPLMDKKFWTVAHTWNNQNYLSFAKSKMHQIVEKRNSIYEIIIIMYHYIVLIITVSVLDSIFVVGRVLLGFFGWAFFACFIFIDF